MARFLFTLWPFPGHVHPNMAVAHALRERGHEVRFYTSSMASPTIEGEGFGLFPFQKVDEDLATGLPDGTRANRKRPFKLSALWRDLLIGTLSSQIQDLDEILSEWKPDVIVCDPIMWGPLLVTGEAHGIPVAVFSYTLACMLPGEDAPILGLSYPKAHSSFARMRARFVRLVSGLMTGRIAREASRLRSSHGLPPLRTSVNEFAGTMPLYLMCGTNDLDYQRADLPDSVKYVGLCAWSKPSDLPPPEWIAQLPDDKPLVFISEGTLPGKAPVTLQAAAEGLKDLPLQVVMTTVSDRSLSELGLDKVSPNVRVERYVPHSDIFPRTDVVVANGGAGTVLASLKEGIPLLVIPTAFEQPENAWRVVESGAGLHLSYDRCTPERLRKAVQRLLYEPSFKENARRVGADLARHGGGRQAAELLQELADAPVLQTDKASATNPL